MSVTYRTWHLITRFYKKNKKTYIILVDAALIFPEVIHPHAKVGIRFHRRSTPSQTVVPLPPKHTQDMPHIWWSARLFPGTVNRYLGSCPVNKYQGRYFLIPSIVIWKPEIDIHIDGMPKVQQTRKNHVCSRYCAVFFGIHETTLESNIIEITAIKRHSLVTTSRHYFFLTST